MVPGTLYVRARARGPDRPPEPVPRCGSVDYDPGGTSVLLCQPVAAVRAPQRVILRSVVSHRVVRCRSLLGALSRTRRHHVPVQSV